MQALTKANAGFEVLREEWLPILFEIGFDEISTATSFVEYFCEAYSISRSSIWYRLKRMKEMGLLDFSEKGEEPRPLALTEKGREVLRHRVARTHYGLAFQVERHA